MNTQKVVQFGGIVFGLFVAMWLCGYLIPWLFMSLWNDMSPHFGIDVQLTWWETCKVMVLIGSIGWLFNSSNLTFTKRKKDKDGS